jgi:hypothetical protein
MSGVGIAPQTPLMVVVTGRPPSQRAALQQIHRRVQRHHDEQHRERPVGVVGRAVEMRRCSLSRPRSVVAENLASLLRCRRRLSTQTVLQRRSARSQRPPLEAQWSERLTSSRTNSEYRRRVRLARNPPAQSTIFPAPALHSRAATDFFRIDGPWLGSTRSDWMPIVGVRGHVMCDLRHRLRGEADWRVLPNLSIGSGIGDRRERAHGRGAMVLRAPSSWCDNIAPL